MLENELHLIVLARLMSKKEVKLMKAFIRRVGDARKGLDDYMEKIQRKYIEEVSKAI